MASITISAAAARVVTPIAKAPSGSAKLGRSAAPANAAASRVSFPARKPRSLTVTSAGLPPNLAGMMGNMDPEKLKEIQAAYEQAMKDPAMMAKAKAMAQAMYGAGGAGAGAGMGGGADGDAAAELARLRAENAALKNQMYA